MIPLKKAPEGYHKVFVFEGLRHNNSIRITPISPLQYKEIMSSYVTISKIDRLRHTYKIVKKECRRYDRFIYSVEHYPVALDEIQMKKLGRKAQLRLTRLLLESVMFINNVSRVDDNILNKYYLSNAFILTKILRNVLEHEFDPIQRIEHTNNLKMEKQHFILFANKDVLMDYAVHNGSKKYRERNKAAVYAYKELRTNFVNISDAINFFLIQIKNIYLDEISALVNQIPSNVIEILDFYKMILKKKYRLRYVAEETINEENIIWPLYRNRRSILSRKTLKLILMTSHSS